VFGSHEYPDFFHSDLLYLHESKRINYTRYHHYSPAPSGELRATEEGTYDASKSEAMRTRVYRAPVSSSVRSTLRPDPSTSGFFFSSWK
jgi:hypothetical protein